MAPRLTPTMRQVLDVLRRERPLTVHALAGFMPGVPLRRIEVALCRLVGENLARVVSYDADNYPAYAPGSPVGNYPRRRRKGMR